MGWKTLSGPLGAQVDQVDTAQHIGQLGGFETAAETDPLLSLGQLQDLFGKHGIALQVAIHIQGLDSL